MLNRGEGCSPIFFAKIPHDDNLVVPYPQLFPLSRILPLKLSPAVECCCGGGVGGDAMIDDGIDEQRARGWRLRTAQARRGRVLSVLVLWR